MTAAIVLIAACVVLLGGAVLVIPFCRNRLLAGQIAFGATAVAGLLASGSATTLGGRRAMTLRSARASSGGTTRTSCSSATPKSASPRRK